jgi:hypothetical protein
MSDVGPEREADTCNLECRAAVLRAFNELCKLGECEQTALRAALRVFAFYQPALPADVASAIVAKWTRGSRPGARWSIRVN